MERTVAEAKKASLESDRKEAARLQEMLRQVETGVQTEADAATLKREIEALKRNIERYERELRDEGYI